jgi:membrane fusion protein, multidrug efflux system
VNVHTRIQGRVVQVYCRPGQSVTRGQLLFGIDQVSYKILLDKAQAAVRQARARQKRSKIELDYSKKLSERNVVSQNEVNLIESKYEEASAALEEAEADRQLAQENLDSTRVVAPIDGVIGRIVVRQGEPAFMDSATNRSSPLATIVPLDPLYVDFYIEQALAQFLDRSRGGRRLKPGENPELPVLISVNDGAGFVHRGQVDFLDPEFKPIAEQAIHLRATIPNPDHTLAPGMRARIRLVTNARHKAIVIPEASARFPRGSSEYVYVVDDRDVVQKRAVRIGLRYGDLREVEDGLKPDDWVVTYPGGVSEGQKVILERVKPEEFSR